MIELQRVSKKYDSVRAVDNLTLRVEEGETFGLIGTSGSGKTTTLKMINRLIEADEGSIIIKERDIRSLDPVELRRGIGYVIQKSGLFPHYTVAENIGVVPRLLGWPKQAIEEKTYELLALVGLPPGEYIHRYPNNLSGGQQQRVGLARALAADPAIVLLDEPFGGVDPITSVRIREQFKKLTSHIKKTMVLVTHDVTEAFDLCDRIALLDHGKLQQTGTPKELLFKPRNDFVKIFFDSDRFILELQVIHIHDILTLLASKKSGNPKGPQLKTSASVKEAIQSLEQFEDSHPVAVIENEQGDPIAFCDESDLLRGFYVRREQLAGEDEA